MQNKIRAKFIKKLESRCYAGEMNKNKNSDRGTFWSAFVVDIY